ncbi:MAG: response regulator [bacterium]
MDTKGTILVVDDDLDICETVIEILKFENYDATAALNGPDALKSIKNEACDIVLLDLKMPEMDGLDVLREIKKIAPRLPVIIHSALGFDQTTQTTLREGAFAAIKKPIDFDLLFSVCDSAMSPAKRILILSGDISSAEPALSILAGRKLVAKAVEHARSALTENTAYKYDLMALVPESLHPGAADLLRKIRYIRPDMPIAVKKGFSIINVSNEDVAADLLPLIYLEDPLDPEKLFALVNGF